GLPAVEGRARVALLRLVAQHQRDLALQVDAFQFAIADRRRLDAVAGEDDLAVESPGAGGPERRPVLRGQALDRVALRDGHAGLDLHGLAIAGGERRAQSERAQPLLEVVRRAAQARGPEAAALH